MLIAENGFVLGTMIHEHSMNIFHLGDKHHIQHKNDDADNAFKQGVKLQKRTACHYIDQKSRQPHKQEKSKPKAEHGGDDADNVHHFLAEMIVDPAVELRKVFRILLQALCGFFSGLHKVAVTRHKRFNKADNTANKRE